MFEHKKQFYFKFFFGIFSRGFKRRYPVKDPNYKTKPIPNLHTAKKLFTSIPCGRRWGTKLKVFTGT